MFEEMFFLGEESCAMHNLSIDAAAREIARLRIPADNEEAIEQICYEHGVPLNYLTNDECYYMSRLIEDYANY